MGEKEAITDAGYVATMKGMVAAMGYAWKDVAFSNICGERNSAKPPTEAEMAIALPAFKQKVARLQPRAIIVLGEVAALGLLGNRDIAALRQRPHTFEGLPAIPTYHPAYLNKFGNAVKADACRDLRKALLRIGRPVPAVLERFK